MGTESHGSYAIIIKIAGLPEERQPGFFILARIFFIRSLNKTNHISSVVLFDANETL